jgi:hypothetical protein
MKHSFFGLHSRKVKGTQCFRNFSISNDLFTKTFTAQWNVVKYTGGPTARVRKKRPFSKFLGAQNAVRARDGGHESGQDVAGRSKRQSQTVTI